MVKYLCHNCDDISFRSITQVVNHVWDKHRVEVTKRMQLVKRAEDARLPLKKTGIQRVFRCERCNVVLKDTFSFLAHLDKWHRIHIWYEKGLTRKRVFFDGILKGSSTEDLVKQHQRRRVNKMRLGTQQKKILTTLEAYPSLTILEVANKIHGKNVTVGGKEYNSICRSLHILEANGYVEKQVGQIRWHLKKEYE